MENQAEKNLETMFVATLLLAALALSEAIVVQQGASTRKQGKVMTIPLERNPNRVNVHLPGNHVARMRAEGIEHVKVASARDANGQVSPVNVPIAGAMVVLFFAEISNSFFFFFFFPLRVQILRNRSFMARSRLARHHKTSKWCLTPARRICGFRRKHARGLTWRAICTIATIRPNRRRM